MDEDLDWVSVSLQTVGKAVPMVAAQQSKEVTECQDSGLVSLALPWMCCAAFDKLLRKSFKWPRYNWVHLYKSACFSEARTSKSGKISTLDSSPLLSLQNVPFSFFLLASPSVK